MKVFLRNLMKKIKWNPNKVLKMKRIKKKFQNFNKTKMRFTTINEKI